MREFGMLLYLAPLAQRTCSAKINIAPKMLSLGFYDMLYQSELKLICASALIGSGDCTKIYMCQIFTFYSSFQTLTWGISF
jgi:hypothetical protein